MSEILGKAGLDEDNIGSSIVEQLENSLNQEDSVGRMCATVVRCIDSKIRIFTHLKSEASACDESRLYMNRLKKKLSEYQRKNEAAMSARLQREHDEAQLAYKTAEAELTGKLQFLKSSTQEVGASALVVAELSAFAKLQKQFFLSCAAIYPRDSAVEKQECGTLLNKLQTFLDSLDSAGKNNNHPSLTEHTPTRQVTGSSAHNVEIEVSNEETALSTPKPATDNVPTISPLTKVHNRDNVAPAALQTIGRILYSYEPTQHDELKLVEGETIVVLKQHPDGWWSGQLESGMYKKHLSFH